MLAAVLLFALTPGCALGERIKVQSHDFVSSSEESSVGSTEAAWALRFREIPCVLPTDLSSLGVFANGLKGSWNMIKGGMWSGKAKVTETLIKQSREFASKSNCKRCNIEVLGSIMPTKTGKVMPHISATVTCASEHPAEGVAVNHANLQKELANNCFREHGNLGKFVEPSPLGACVPCPVKCDFGCTTPGTTDMGWSSSKWFKCITSTPAQMAPTGDWSTASVAPNKNHYMLEAGPELPGYECQGSAFDQLSQDAQTILTVGGHTIEPKKQVPKFFASKKRKGMWNLWCMYKDHTASFDEEARGSMAVEGSTWMLDTGVSSCTVEEGSLSSDGSGSPSSFSSILAKGAAGMMQEQATRQNCLICSPKYGGRVTDLLSFSQSTALTDLTGKPWSDVALWVQAECATQELGSAACNLKRGTVGWSASRPCMPCPEECVSCAEVKTAPGKPAKFKCVLLPMVKFPAPSLKSLTEADSGAAPDNLYKMPAGLTCDAPVPRKCGGKSLRDGWCKAWQFKTECLFASEFQ